MPANPKYLTKNPWQKFAKISAGILGGYLICALIHMILPTLLMPYKKEVVLTSVYSFFIIWTALMLPPFLFENGWRAWMLYIGVIIILGGIYFFINLN